ncbi:MAG: VanW family protein [bacterium]
MVIKDPKLPISKKQTARLLIIIAAVFVLFLLVAGEEIYMANRVYPGLTVGSAKLGLKTRTEALKLVQEQTDAFMQKGITVKGEGKTVLISLLAIAPTDPDLAYEIISFNNEKIVDQAISLGKSQNPWISFKDRFLLLLGKKSIPPAFQIDEMELARILKNNFGNLENPAQEAQLTFDQNLRPQVSQETSGQAFDYDLALAEIRLNALKLTNQPIVLSLKPDFPTIKKSAAGAAIEAIPEFLKLTPITLKYTNDQASWQNRQWTIDTPLLRSWLRLALSEADNQVVLSLKETEVKIWLAELAKAINIEPLNAKFKIENGRVTEFQASRDGQEVDLDKTYQELVNQIIKDKKQEAKMIVRKTLAKIAIGEVNDLGIRELVGRGVSDFSGSPVNRRHNIATGAAAINGLLIKPGQEFSLNDALGKIEASTGYLPELVIKGNETKPEYGGGLCQIGTTAFRLALNTGLPITERKNHSYRVSYYEPAGTDATIYGPHPDLKFINDMATNLLLQTRIEGNEVIFEFYGASDNRRVEQTEPKIFNFVKPPATKIIETLDLKPGEKKCTERAHTGADTEFSRKVTYANSEIKEETWTSHYRPWQEVCLLGVEQLTPSVETGTASDLGSIESINTNANPNN